MNLKFYTTALAQPQACSQYDNESPPLYVDPKTSVQSVTQCRDRVEDKDIMIRTLIRITVLLLWLSCRFEYTQFTHSYIFVTISVLLMIFSFNIGRSLNTKVHQAPSSIFGAPNGSETINCNHSVSSYNTILWYQQSIGDSALKLIGYILYKDPTLEDQFKHHFKVTGDGSVKSELHVLKLRQTEDSVMYYCAASKHSDSITSSPLQKPSLIIHHINSHWRRAHLHLTNAYSRKSPPISIKKSSLPLLT